VVRNGFEEPSLQSCLLENRFQSGIVVQATPKRTMEVYYIVFDYITEIVRGFLASLQVHPSSYSFLFPPALNSQEMDQMIANGVFPTIEGLAPAVTYSILLSAARFILQYLIFQVRYTMDIFTVRGILQFYYICPFTAIRASLHENQSPPPC
jgi:hypothetical protein